MTSASRKAVLREPLVPLLVISKIAGQQGRVNVWPDLPTDQAAILQETPTLAHQLIQDERLSRTGDAEFWALDADDVRERGPRNDQGAEEYGPMRLTTEFRQHRHRRKSVNFGDGCADVPNLYASDKDSLGVIWAAWEARVRVEAIQHEGLAAIVRPTPGSTYRPAIGVEGDVDTRHAGSVSHLRPRVGPRPPQGRLWHRPVSTRMAEVRVGGRSVRQGQKEKLAV
jgi:hypothetical protein